MSELDPILELAKLVAAVVIGGLIAAFISHEQSWKVEVGRTYLEPGGFSFNPWSFSDFVSSFAGQCVLIRRGLTSKRQGGSINVKGGCKKIQKAFDEIVELVNAS